MDDVLKVKNLKISFDTFGGKIDIVRGVSLSVKKGEILALVGESGCGKSVTAQEIMGLNPRPPSHIEEGKIYICGKEVTALSPKEASVYRGKTAGMIFQNPLTGLNPTMKMGRQITESLLRQGELSAKECEKEAVRLLESVQIPNASLRAKEYPHAFSGGMRQRAMIAMALANNPQLLIADEPTTALDVTIQLEILRLLHDICKKRNMAVLFITHDFSVVASMAHRVAVMYGGKILEEAEMEEIFAAPSHPYTKGLLESVLPLEKGGMLKSIPGTPPNLSAAISGCAFAPRCKKAMVLCEKRDPPMYQLTKNHTCACWRYHPDFSEEGVRP